jgi:hypothetical protein
MARVIEQEAPRRLCAALAQALNAIGEADDGRIIWQAEDLLAPHGIHSWPSEATPAWVSRHGLTTKAAAELLDKLRGLQP